jgi:alpha-tubulin suppressor-like RCC1 family protein
MAFSVGPGIQLGGGIILGAPNLGPPGIGTVITTSTTSSYSTYAVTVPFTAPCSNVVCSPITSYVATSIPPGNSNTGTTSPITIGNLIYGVPYTFSVSAINAKGIGAASVTSNSIPGYGSLWSWGYNNTRQLGLGTLASTNNYSNPTQYSASTTWTTATTNMYTNASWIQPNGTLWSWGYNAQGQLGVGNTTVYSSPKQVGALTNWLSVSGGYGMVALKTDGTLWTWGYNAYGQLATGNTTSYSSPKQISTGTTWKSVSASSALPNHVMAVRSDGTLWAWGYNAQGQLGINNASNYSSLKQVGSFSTWLAVAAGYQFTLAIDTSGKLWAWGSNGYGVLGINNTTSYSSPKQVGAMTNWSRQLFTGHNTAAAAIKTDGTLWTWGYNGYGQLGLSDTATRSSPVQVGALTTWRQLAVGSGTTVQHMLGITQDGKLWAWGYNNYGQLGVNDIVNRSSPTQVGNNSNWHAIGAGYQSSYGVQTTNTFGPLPPTNLVATAYNYNTIGVTLTSPAVTNIPQSWTITMQSPSGVITTSTTVQTTSTLFQNVPYSADGYQFTATTTNAIGTSVVSTVSNIATGTQYISMWGYNGSGNLATGNTTNYYSPKNVGSYSGWASWSMGVRSYSVGAIKADGTLWQWGQNQNGQLGNNTTNNYSSPQQVGANTNWAMIATDNHTLAVDTSGRLWAWGYNGYGQLGLSNFTNYSSPKQVGALTNWSKVYVGVNSSYGIKTDGTLWSWGQGIYGSGYQLGNGSSTNLSSPVQVGALTNWLSISAGNYAIHAMKTDGTAWWWGYAGPSIYDLNNSYQNQPTSPVQFTSITSQWRVTTSTKTIYNGYQTYHGITSGGALWTSGWYGSYGMFGTGTASASGTSYQQVGSLTNWWWISTADQHAVAIKTDGTIWTWGYNPYGNIGRGNTTNYSSPVQVGALTNWTLPATALGQAYNAVPYPIAGFYSVLAAHR